MKKTLLSMLLAALFTASTLAEMAHAAPPAPTPGHALANDIEVAEWNLKHSSVAATITPDALSQSLALLSRAREELGRGHVKTAQDLTRRASQPIIHMQELALKGKHPDPGLYSETIRQSLVSIMEAAERIAQEKSAPRVVLDVVRESLRRSDELLALKQLAPSHDLLLQAYAQIQQYVADLRQGDHFYIQARPAAGNMAAADWNDGLRRMEDRRAITDYLRLEAQAQGVDIQPLQAGVTQAEAAFEQAASMARQERWDQALRTLDVAYVRYEESWRAVGVEW
jgi:hypothetical protein